MAAHKLLYVALPLFGRQAAPSTDTIPCARPMNVFQGTIMVSKTGPMQPFPDNASLEGLDAS